MFYYTYVIICPNFRADGGAQMDKLKKIKYYIDTLTYFQNNVDKLNNKWAKFLLNDKVPNKEKLLWEKKKLDSK